MTVDTASADDWQAVVAGNGSTRRSRRAATDGHRRDRAEPRYGDLRDHRRPCDRPGQPRSRSSWHRRRRDVHSLGRADRSRAPSRRRTPPPNSSRSRAASAGNDVTLTLDGNAYTVAHDDPASDNATDIAPLSRARSAARTRSSIGAALTIVKVAGGSISTSARRRRYSRALRRRRRPRVRARRSRRAPATSGRNRPAPSTTPAWAPSRPTSPRIWSRLHRRSSRGTTLTLAKATTSFSASVASTGSAALGRHLDRGHGHARQTARTPATRLEPLRRVLTPGQRLRGRRRRRLCVGEPDRRHDLHRVRRPLDELIYVIQLTGGAPSFTLHIDRSRVGRRGGNRRPRQPGRAHAGRKT